MVGPQEQAINDTFDPDGIEDGGGWQWTSWDHFAPDGETLLGRVTMLCCPICGSLVAAPPDDTPERLRWDLKHIRWHLDMARRIDRAEEVGP